MPPGVKGGPARCSFTGVAEGGSGVSRICEPVSAKLQPEICSGTLPSGYYDDPATQSNGVLQAYVSIHILDKRQCFSGAGPVFASASFGGSAEPFPFPDPDKSNSSHSHSYPYALDCFKMTPPWSQAAADFREIRCPGTAGAIRGFFMSGLLMGVLRFDIIVSISMKKKLGKIATGHAVYVWV